MSVTEVLKYIGIDEENVENLKCQKPSYTITKSYDNSMLYKIYKFVKVKDIDILISNTDRTTDIKERYALSQPINEYIKENYQEFEHLASIAKVSEIEELENFQKELNNHMPYFVRYEKNYIWQIYYSKEDNRYFMLFPAREGDISVLFFMIKQKLQNPETIIYVPICKAAYEEYYLKNEEITDIENYLFLFTKELPTIFEVERKEKTTYIVGKAKLKEGLVSKYRIEIKSREDAEEVYTLLKALFILTTETSYKYKFEPTISKDGSLNFEYEGESINSDNLAEFISREANIQNDRKEDIIKSIEDTREKLENIKREVNSLSEIYRNYEKQIVAFLECKKSVFKKVKFFFKKTKKPETYVTIEGKEYIEEDEETIVEKKKNSMKKLDLLISKKAGQAEEKLESGELEDEENTDNEYKVQSYTLADLIRMCKENLEKDSEYKNLKADFNAMKIKRKNMKSKIDNAKDYVAEIEKHKKSIVAFWKFTSKDAVPNLTKGSEVEQENKLQVSFNFDEDMQEVGQKADSIQKQKLSTDECNSIYACNYILKSINAVFTGKDEDKILSEELESLKKHYKNSKKTEIFGEFEEDYTKVKNLGNNKHRENKKNIYGVLKVNDRTILDEYKNTVENIVKMLNEAYKKITSVVEFPVYYSRGGEGKYIIADIDPKNIIDNYDNTSYNKSKEKSYDCRVFKTNITKDMHILYLSNITYYDNYNKTLPNGMDEGTKVIIKLDEINSGKQSEINIIEQEDLYNVKVKNIKVIENN